MDGDAEVPPWYYDKFYASCSSWVSKVLLNKRCTKLDSTYRYCEAWALHLILSLDTQALSDLMLTLYTDTVGSAFWVPGSQYAPYAYRQRSEFSHLQARTEDKAATSGDLKICQAPGLMYCGKWMEHGWCVENQRLSRSMTQPLWNIVLPASILQGKIT